MDATTLELVDRIHALYGRSWDQLLAVMAILAVLLGGVVPFWIHWSQRRIFKVQEEELQRSIRDGIAAAAESLDRDLKQVVHDELESGQQKLEEAMKRSASLLEGHSLFLQGQLLLFNRQPVLALELFIGSARQYLKAKKEYHLQCALLNIKQSIAILQRNPVLPPGKFAMGQAGGADRDRIDEDLESTFDRFITRIKDSNSDGRYTLEIDTIKTAFKAALAARDKLSESRPAASAGSTESG